MPIEGRCINGFSVLGWLGHSAAVLQSCQSRGPCRYPAPKLQLGNPLSYTAPDPGDTNPKRKRGAKSFPRLRFGLVWDVSNLTGSDIATGGQGAKVPKLELGNQGIIKPPKKSVTVGKFRRTRYLTGIGMGFATPKWSDWVDRASRIVPPACLPRRSDHPKQKENRSA